MLGKPKSHYSEATDLNPARYRAFFPLFSFTSGVECPLLGPSRRWVTSNVRSYVTIGLKLSDNIPRGTLAIYKDRYFEEPNVWGQMISHLTLWFSFPSFYVFGNLAFCQTWKFFLFFPSFALSSSLFWFLFGLWGKGEKRKWRTHTHTSSPPTHAHTRTHAHAHTEKERERENVPLSFLLLSDSFKMIWEWGIME